MLIVVEEPPTQTLHPMDTLDAWAGGGDTQWEGPPDSLTDSQVPADFPNTIPPEVLQHRHSLKEPSLNNKVEVTTPSPMAGSSGATRAALPVERAPSFAAVAAALNESPTRAYAFRQELGAARLNQKTAPDGKAPPQPPCTFEDSVAKSSSAIVEVARSRSPPPHRPVMRSRTTAEKLFMTAASRWDKWEDIPVGIQQSFMDKLGSRFPVKLGQLPVESTNYKVFFEIECTAGPKTQHR